MKCVFRQELLRWRGVLKAAFHTTVNRRCVRCGIVFLSQALSKAWRFGQQMRQFFDYGDVRDAVNSQMELQRQQVRAATRNRVKNYEVVTGRLIGGSTS